MGCARGCPVNVERELFCIRILAAGRLWWRREWRARTGTSKPNVEDNPRRRLLSWAGGSRATRGASKWSSSLLIPCRRRPVPLVHQSADALHSTRPDSDQNDSGTGFMIRSRTLAAARPAPGAKAALSLVSGAGHLGPASALGGAEAEAAPAGPASALCCPGRKPPLSVVKCPSRPYKSPLQNGFS